MKLAISFHQQTTGASVATAILDGRVIRVCGCIPQKANGRSLPILIEIEREKVERAIQQWIAIERIERRNTKRLTSTRNRVE